MNGETYEAGADLPGGPHTDVAGLVDKSSAVDSVTVLVGVHVHRTDLQEVRYDAHICSTNKQNFQKSHTISREQIIHFRLSSVSMFARFSG